MSGLTPLTEHPSMMRQPVHGLAAALSLTGKRPDTMLRTEQEMTDLLRKIGPLQNWSESALEKLEDWLANAGMELDRERVRRADAGATPQPAAAEHATVFTCLKKMLASPVFSTCHEQQKFLSYLVEQTLKGHGKRLKGYSIGVDVFGRPHCFDPNQDAIVRVKAKRLRAKLGEYYQSGGKADEVHFHLEKGSYEINFNYPGIKL